jgi:hypothetical protein
MEKLNPEVINFVGVFRCGRDPNHASVSLLIVGVKKPIHPLLGNQTQLCQTGGFASRTLSLTGNSRGKLGRGDADIGKYDGGARLRRAVRLRPASAGQVTESNQGSTESHPTGLRRRGRED